MVSALTKLFGAQHFELAQDVVQDTLLHALNIWKLKGIPPNPTAWLYAVAKNKTIDVLRRNRMSVNVDFTETDNPLLQSEYTLQTAVQHAFDESGIKDDVLRMMYACCHPALNIEHQITLILKTLCGFSTAEVGRAMVASADTISKRLYRSKQVFREQKIAIELPDESQIVERTSAVVHALYLMFNEGYASTNANEHIRQDLQKDAISLCKQLEQNPSTNVPEVHALLALMCFHVARNDGRINAVGQIVLLPQQDRSVWNRELIEIGNYYMDQAATGGAVSRYHIEAAISYEHVSAATFADTNWSRIVSCYEWLSQIAPSPIIIINRSAALFYAGRTVEARAMLVQNCEAFALDRSALYHALMAEICDINGEWQSAVKSLQEAIKVSRNPAELAVFERRMLTLMDRI